MGCICFIPNPLYVNIFIKPFIIYIYKLCPVSIHLSQEMGIKKFNHVCLLLYFQCLWRLSWCNAYHILHIYWSQPTSIHFTIQTFRSWRSPIINRLLMLAILCNSHFLVHINVIDLNALMSVHFCHTYLIESRCVKD